MLSKKCSAIYNSSTVSEELLAQILGVTESTLMCGI
jgi:hypothetical protein